MNKQISFLEISLFILWTLLYNSNALTQDLEVPSSISHEGSPHESLSTHLSIVRDQIVNLGGSPNDAFIIQETLSNYPDLEESIALEIAEDAASGKISARFWENFVVLSRLRTLDALKVIGTYLSDDRVLYSQPGHQGDRISSKYAAVALSNMNLSNAPTSAYGWSELSSAETKAWRVWWEENKDNLEAALNPPEESPTPRPANEGPNLPPRAPAPVQETQTAPTPADNSNLAAILLIALGLIVAAGAAILLRRRE